MTQTLTDILGNEIIPGDKVVYPQGSGRSIQMVVAEFISYNGTTAQLRRLEGSRWTPSWTSTHYRNKNTGKGIDIYASGFPHHEVAPSQWYQHKETGAQLGVQDFYALPGTDRFVKWVHEYDSGKLKDYVEEYYPDAPPVTIRNVSNIVKVS